MTKTCKECGRPFAPGQTISDAELARLARGGEAGEGTDHVVGLAAVLAGVLLGVGGIVGVLIGLLLWGPR